MVIQIKSMNKLSGIYTIEHCFLKNKLDFQGLKQKKNLKKFF